MTATNTRTTVELGALADPLTEQLDGLAATETLAKLEIDRKAIARCHLMGYMPEAQTRRARQKLLRAIQAECAKFARAFNG